ncbi:hypothetical protein [Pseudoalteromonas sp. NBT06-2]|uniref:hypothetical protein n=1 Tax=Pseudoalteromonas sp. NBT06-2 TaxID=2025950 RepID=UPI001BB04CDD|nr:hypothetical protein [Pseudoalteromonas sp. NBT06-2]
MYYHKDKWKSIFPTISHLSERYDDFYQIKPNAMQAQLCFYLEKQGYTTNLVINQIIIVLSISHSLGINKLLRQQLIAACLCQYICIQKENNAIASQQKLSPQSVKLFKMRYSLTLRLLDYGQVPNGIIQDIFRNITLYTQITMGKKQGILVNKNTLIISIATYLAKQITIAKNHNAKSLASSIATLYLECNQFNVQFLLKKLIGYLPEVLPGTMLKGPQSTYYIGTYYKNEKPLYLNFNIPLNHNSSKGSFSLAKLQNLNNKPQQICQDQGIIFKIWFQPLSDILSKNELISNQMENLSIVNDTLELLESSLKAKNHHSIEDLCQLLSPYQEISEELCKLASNANRTEQSIHSVRHAIMMLGAIRTPLLIQKLILQMQLEELGISQWFLLKAKVNSLVSAAEKAAQQIYDFLPEEAGICILQYCLTVLTETNKIPLKITNFDTKAVLGSPFLAESLLGIEQPIDVTSSNMHEHLSKEWLSAIETLQKKSIDVTTQLFSNHIYCLGIALLTTNKIYKPEYNFDAYTNDFISKALKNLKLTTLDNYLHSLSELHFNNYINFN